MLSWWWLSASQGLLALEGELTPILVQMVKSANMNGLLDNDIESLSGCQQRVKARLHEIMQKDQIFGEEDFDRVNQSVRHLLNYGVYFSPSADLIWKAHLCPLHLFCFSSWLRHAAALWWTLWRLWRIQWVRVIKSTPLSRASPHRSAKDLKTPNQQVIALCSH